MEGDIEDEELWGMIPRSSATLLTALGERATDFTVKASYLELCKSSICLPPIILCIVAHQSLPYYLLQFLAFYEISL